MAYLNENEWILFNEITYNIHFRPSETGQFALVNPVGHQLSSPMVTLWKEQTRKYDRLR